MLSPATAMMMARARETAVRRESQCTSAGGDERAVHKRRHGGVADSTSGRRMLVSKTYELVRLADSLGYRRDEVVRMIQSLS